MTSVTERKRVAKKDMLSRKVQTKARAMSSLLTAYLRTTTYEKIHWSGRDDAVVRGRGPHKDEGSVGDDLDNRFSVLVFFSSVRLVHHQFIISLLACIWLFLILTLRISKSVYRLEVDRRT